MVQRARNAGGGASVTFPDSAVHPRNPLRVGEPRAVRLVRVEGVDRQGRAGPQRDGRVEPSFQGRLGFFQPPCGLPPGGPGRRSSGAGGPPRRTRTRSRSRRGTSPRPLGSEDGPRSTRCRPPFPSPAHGRSRQEYDVRPAARPHPSAANLSHLSCNRRRSSRMSGVGDVRGVGPAVEELTSRGRQPEREALASGATMPLIRTGGSEKESCRRTSPCFGPSIWAGRPK